MALTSFPFDNADSTESQYSALFRELQDTGVVDAASGALLVTSNSGFNLRVAAGSAIVRGFMAILDADDVSKTAASPPGTGTRWDLVVLRLDPTANAITLEILPGTPGAGEPTPTQTDTGIWEEPLAAYPLTAGDSTFTTIQDRRRFVGRRTGLWTTALRPAAPTQGKLGLNVTTGLWEFYTGSGWTNLIPATVDNSTKWNGYNLVVSATTPAGTPTADRIWIQPIA